MKWCGNTPSTQVTKKQETREDKMNLGNHLLYWLKCYLKVFKIVSDVKSSYNTLAIALNDKCLFLEKNFRNYFNFLRVILGSLSSTLTIQDNLFSSESSSMPAISEGIVVLNDLDFGFCLMIFEVTSNNFIHSFLLFFINIFDNILYIIYPQKIKS